MIQFFEWDWGLVCFLIEVFDDDGYLFLFLQELLEMLFFEYEIELDDFEIVLNYIQSFDLIGIGVCSLWECLVL